jgi:hypothetical protein
MTCWPMAKLSGASSTRSASGIAMDVDVNLPERRQLRVATHQTISMSGYSHLLSAL